MTFLHVIVVGIYIYIYIYIYMFYLSTFLLTTFPPSLPTYTQPSLYHLQRLTHSSIYFPPSTQLSNLPPTDPSFICRLPQGSSTHPTPSLQRCRCQRQSHKQPRDVIVARIRSGDGWSFGSVGVVVEARGSEIGCG